MENTQITNYYEHLPENGQPPKQLVILLHGLGSNGQDLISLAPFFARGLPDAVFISPDAPFACDMAPSGYPNSFQWFSLQDRDPNVMLSGIRVASPIIEDFISEQLKRFGLGADKLALSGFSQGTMMSLYTAPRYKEQIAGVLGYSGALIWGQDVAAADLHKMPIHLIHGEADDVVPVEAWHSANQILKASGFEVSGHTTANLPHSIDEEGIQQGASFLHALFN